MNLRDLQRVIPEQWKIQSKSRDGKKSTIVAYIDARDVMKLLDEVAGPENWKDEYDALDPELKRVKCRLSVKVREGADGQEEWVTKEDIGTASEYEGEKGAFSDAFKRAAVKWGIGRFLYDLDTLSVNIDQYGNLIDDYGKRIQDLTEYARKQLETKRSFEEPIIRQQHGVICDKCGHLMKKRTSASGTFLGCSNYPNCKNTKSLPMAVEEPTQMKHTLKRA